MTDPAAPQVTLAQLEKLLMPRQLAALLCHYGGTSVKLPKRCAGATFERLAGAVGHAGARALCNAFAPTSLYIPRNAKDERMQRDFHIERLLKHGHSATHLALTFSYEAKLSERHIRRIASRLQADRQAGLFEGL